MDFFDMVLPVFVDYLGCFDLGLDGINSPPDVMRELHERGVQENRFLPYGELVIEEDQLVLRDSPHRVVADRFDLRSIENPVAFFRKNADPNDQDGFSRVVIFLEVKAGHLDSRARFHAFQCCDSDPVELVEMIKSARASFTRGTLTRQSSNNSLDSNFILGSRNSIIFRGNGTDSVRSATIRRNGASNRASLPFKMNETTESRGGIPVTIPTPPPTTDGKTHKKLEKKPSIPLVTNQTAGALGFERPSFQYSISEDPVQKDTILLNYCIDDIERFRAEIRAKHFPDEVLGKSRRLSEPRAIDFVNIFQKFKLAFNLLGRLEEFLEEPSAAEMLHHLFPPLAFLVDECFEEFDEDLVRDVVYPLPTPKAVDFLERSLGPREAVIWRALGENWLDPNVRSQNEIVPYSPRFHDGWSPGVISFAFPNERQTSMKKSAENGKKQSRSSSSSDEVFERLQPYNGSSSHNSAHDDYRDELMSMGAKIGLVTCSKEAQTSKELTVTKGEYVEIVNDTKNWWRCINSEGKAGFVPCNLLKAIFYEDGEKYRQDAFNKPQRPQLRKSSSKRKQRTERYDSSSGSDTINDESPKAPRPPVIPTAPAPPPLPRNNFETPKIIPKPQPKRNNIANSSVRSTISMQDELRSVLDLINNAEEKPFEVHTTPDVYITHRSSPKEIRSWLIAKEFSQRAVDQLSKLDGTKLFAMSRKDLIAAFGKQEGIRLDSQITISRNNSDGYQTAKTSELRGILEKARRRSEKARHSSVDRDTSVA